MNIYINTLGRFVKVTAVFTDEEQANNYLKFHPNDGVIHEESGAIFMADINDEGFKVS